MFNQLQMYSYEVILRGHVRMSEGKKGLCTIETSCSTFASNCPYDKELIRNKVLNLHLVSFGMERDTAKATVTAILE